MPPLMNSASCFKCSSPSSHGPANKNTTRITSAMTSSRAITRSRRSGGTGRSPATNVATFPSGSMIVSSSSVAEMSV
jgi:hypothetical protein